MRKSRTSFYNSCKNLPIENFYEILNTHNFNWLRIDHRNGDEYDELNPVLPKLWEEIHEEYVELLSDSGGSKDFTIMANVMELEEELSVVGCLCSLYYKRLSKVLKTEIEAWGYYPDDPDKTLKKLNAIKFKISIIRSKNKDLFEEPEEEIEKIEYDLFSDVVLLEETLGDGRSIDVKTTVVSKWVRYIKNAEKKSKKNGK